MISFTLRVTATVMVVIVILFTSCADTKTVYPRDDFTRMVVGMNAKKARRKIGKPMEVRKKAGYEVWLYEERTKNPESGRNDWYVRLFVRNGKISEVAF